MVRRAQGFNMGKVKYTDYKRLPEDVERELGATYADLDEVVTADIVTLHVPLSDKTCAAGYLCAEGRGCGAGLSHGFVTQIDSLALL